jgi:hypothetical protein
LKLNDRIGCDGAECTSRSLAAVARVEMALLSSFEMSSRSLAAFARVETVCCIGAAATPLKRQT